MNIKPTTIVSVRYMIDDVDAAIKFYTRHFGFTLELNAAPAFASVKHGNLRLLLSGEKSSGRRPLPDGTRPVGLARGSETIRGVPQAARACMETNLVNLLPP